MNNYMTGTLSGIHQPKFVGKLKITDNFSIYVYKKPRLIHRLMYRFLLGWVYEEGAEQECGGNTMDIQK